MVAVSTVPGTNYIDWTKMIEDYKNQQQADVFAEDGILLDRGTLIPVKANHSVAETMRELSTINEENIMSSLNVLLCQVQSKTPYPIYTRDILDSFSKHMDKIMDVMGDKCLGLIFKGEPEDIINSLKSALGDSWKTDSNISRFFKASNTYIAELKAEEADNIKYARYSEEGKKVGMGYYN